MTIPLGSIALVWEPDAAFTAFSGQYTLSPGTILNVMVYLNGLRQKVGVDFSLSGNVVSFLGTPPASDDVVIIDAIRVGP